MVLYENVVYFVQASDTYFAWLLKLNTYKVQVLLILVYVQALSII